MIKSISKDNAKYNELFLTAKAEELVDNLDFGKDKTQEMIANTLGYSSVEEMLSKFKEVLNKLEEGM